MPDQPLARISVVIPVLNSGRTLPRALASIFSQTVQPYEIIVIDGLSTDNTLEILRSHGERIQWISEKDSGTAEAINKGIRRASGDFVTVLLSDDYFAHQFVFENAQARIKAEPMIDALFSSVRRIDPEGLAPTRVFTSSMEDLPKRAALWLAGSFIKLSALQGEKLDHWYKIANDYEFTCRLAYDRKFKIGISPDVVMVMQLGGISGQVKYDFRHSYEKYLIRRRYFGLATALKYAAGAYLVSALRRMHFRPFTWYRKTKRLLVQAS